MGADGLGCGRLGDLELVVVECESLGRLVEVLRREVVVEVLAWLVEERLRVESEVAMRVLRVAWGRGTRRGVLRVAGVVVVRRRTSVWRNCASLALIGASCVVVMVLGCEVLGCGWLGEGGGDVMVPVSVAKSSGWWTLGCGETGEGGEEVLGSEDVASSSERSTPSLSSSESEVLVLCISSWRRMSSNQSKLSSCIGDSGSCGEGVTVAVGS